MFLAMFTVYDKAAGAFLPPFFERTDGAATRAFQQACNSEKHNFFQSPDDYALYGVGSFDDATGKLTPIEPRLIVEARAMKSTDT